MADIFISYKSERRPAAKHLAETLALHGYSVWYDYALVKGRDFSRQIDTEVRAAKVLIVLWCSRSVDSEWVLEEVDLAKARNILVPVKIEACDLPVGNRLKDYVDLQVWDGSPRSHVLDPLLVAVARLVGRAPQANFNGLREYEATWRSFGAPTLARCSLERPLEVSEGARHLGPVPSAPPVPQSPPAPSQDARYRAEGRIKVDARTVNGAPDGWFKPGAGKTEWFKDHEHGPEMVVVPADACMMGSPATEPEREHYLKGSEDPQHKVTIQQPYAVGRHAITRGQFSAFVNNTGHTTEGGAHVWKGDKWGHDPKASWRSPGFAQDDSHPVVCVNWDDATAYAAWLSDQTGKAYRLLTEAEREYATRAGTTTPFWWGSSITPAQANYDGNYTYAGGGSKGEWRKATVPVGSFAANPWGLFNVHGNVWEWCEDVWHDNYNGAPADGSAWLQGGDSSRRVVRGGSWKYDPQSLRSANRNRLTAGNRGDFLGFRLARTLNP